MAAGGGDKGHVSKGEKFVFAVELRAFFFCSPKAHTESAVSPAELVKGSPANRLSTRRQILTDDGGDGQGQRRHGHDDDNHGQLVCRSDGKKSELGLRVHESRSSAP